MCEKKPSVFFTQLRAMLVRNLLLKKREKRKTTAVSTLTLFLENVVNIFTYRRFCYRCTR